MSPTTLDAVKALLKADPGRTRACGFLAEEVDRLLSLEGGDS